MTVATNRLGDVDKEIIIPIISYNHQSIWMNPHSAARYGRMRTAGTYAGEIFNILFRDHRKIKVDDDPKHIANGRQPITFPKNIYLIALLVFPIRRIADNINCFNQMDTNLP